MTTENIISGRRMSPETGVAVDGGEIVNSGEDGLGSRAMREGFDGACFGALVLSTGMACGSETATSEIGEETSVVGDASVGASTASTGPDGRGEYADGGRSAFFDDSVL